MPSKDLYMKEDIKKLCLLKGVIAEAISTPSHTEKLESELNAFDMTIREPLRNIDEYVELIEELENSTSKTVFIESLLVQHDEIDYKLGRMVFTSKLIRLFNRLYRTAAVNGHCVVSINSTGGVYLLSSVAFFISLIVTINEKTFGVVLNKLHHTVEDNFDIFPQPTSPFKDMKAMSDRIDFTVTKKPSST